MDIVAVLELDTPTNVRIIGPDHSPADPDGPVRCMHAAPAEPSGVCARRTLCGLDTEEMTLAPQQFTDHPRPHPRWHTCRSCQTAAQRPAPVDTAPAALTERSTPEAR